MQPDPKAIALGINLVRVKHYSIGFSAREAGVPYDKLWRALNPEKAALRDRVKKENERRRRAAGIHRQKSTPNHIALRDRDIPPEVLADRDYRANLTQTLGQAILGEPMPGRSALDQKRAAACFKSV